MNLRAASFLTALALLPLASPPATGRADEGMWLFNAPPTAQLKERYGFEPSAQWLDHLQKSSVRFFGAGGSGSFVSADGLIITNQHIGADTLQQLSDDKHNYLRDGFYAAARAEEKPCPDMQVNVLMSIEDVTARVDAAVTREGFTKLLGKAPAGQAGSELNAEEAVQARRAVIANIEKESDDQTGLPSSVVTLYEGGAYHLYRYKRYTDVRLVFAPERQAAFYGGDPDDFEYPRYALEVCFLRVYENGQPVRPPEFLRWSTRGAQEHELIFVSGSPAETNRELTSDVLADARDRALPRTLAQFYATEKTLLVYSERSPENARRAREALTQLQNARKANDGLLAGLLDPAFFSALTAKEADLRRHAEAVRDTATTEAFDKIAAAQRETARIAAPYDDLEGENEPAAFPSTLFDVARLLVRAADEKALPNDRRLPTYRDANLPALEQFLFAETPIYDDLETATLTDSLTRFAGDLGATDPLVQKVLAGKSPHERAAELVRGTKLKDVAVRHQLYGGSAEALAAFRDPMLDLARAVDPAARKYRQQYEAQREIQKQAYAQIAKARFALEGASHAPDATASLRLSYGTVEGYDEEGRHVPAFTQIGGLYQRAAEHNNVPPYDLPPRWVESKERLKLDTPFDFVSTADIFGGNSGSPVVNRAGEFVGVIFDGNAQALQLYYGYSDQQARAVSVDARTIIEALRQVYHADALSDELIGSRH